MQTSGILFTAAVTTCLLASCAKDELTAPSDPSAQGLATPLSAEPAPIVDSKMDMPCLDADAPLLGVTWRLQRLSGRPISLAADAARPWLTFSGGPDRTVNGFGGCNTVTGIYAADCESFLFTDLGSTRMYCANTHGLEELFLTALRETESFEVRGERLMLFKGSTEVAALYAHQLPVVPAMENTLINAASGTPPYVPIGNE